MRSPRARKLPLFARGLTRALRTAPRVGAWLLTVAIGCAAACSGDEQATLVEPLYGDPCRYADCGHGSCDSASGQPICACDEGYAGDRCDDCGAGFHRDARQRCIPDRYCAHQEANPCGAHGQCRDETGVIACACDPGYEGARCQLCVSGYQRNPFGECLALFVLDGGVQVMPESCAPDTCHGNGDCEESAAGPTCRCYPGYGGALCELCASGYTLRGERCVADVACGTSECGACEDFARVPDFPVYPDNCMNHETLELAELSLASQAGDGTVWLCAASTVNGLVSEHIVLEASSSRPAQLSFRDRVRELSFELSAGVWSAGKQTLSLEVLGDGESLQPLELDRNLATPLTFTFEPPVETFALRSMDGSTEIAIDNLAYELAVCQ